MITASPTVYQVEVGLSKSHIVRLTSPRPIWDLHKPEVGSFDISCTYAYPDDHSILCKHTVAVLREVKADLSSYYYITTWYSINMYRNTYSYSIEPIRLEDFKDIQLYITDNEYRSDDPFKEKVVLKAKAPKLGQLRGRPKKRRIRKATEAKPKRELRYSHYKQLGYNHRGCRNSRKEESEGRDIEETSSEYTTTSEDELA